MKKVLKYVRLISLIFFVNFVEYIFLPLPYMVLDISLFPLNLAAVLPTIIKSILFVALNIFLCTYLFSACRAKKKYCLPALKLFIKSLLPLLLIKVLFDVAVWFLDHIFYFCNLYLPVYFILDAVFLIIVFGFINRKIKKTENPDVKIRRTKFGKIQMCIAITVFCAVSAIFVFAYMHYSNLINHYAEKYNDYSLISILGGTVQGKIGFLNVCLNCILWTSLWHIFGVSKKFVGDTDNPTAKYVIRSVKKLACIVVVTAVVGVLNFFFFPINMINYFKTTVVPEKFVSGAENFSVQQSNLVISRHVVSLFESGIYQDTKVKITHGKDTVLTFHTDVYDDSYAVDVNFEACRYGCQAIAWEEDDTSKAMLTKNIDKIKENKYITDMLEQLIGEGQFEFFEYGYEYLLKYDKEFIIPYIERYSTGEFSQGELNNSSYIDTSYIQKLAQKAKLKLN